MKPDDLKYNSLQTRLAPYVAKGRPESQAFINWFLEHIYRLDPTASDDAICDGKNDKGIDAIYVEDSSEEIHAFQARTRQSDNATLGDVALKDFSGSIDQLSSPEKIKALLDGNANADLKNLIVRTDLLRKLSNGYQLIGIFLTNVLSDANTNEYLRVRPNLRVYDRQAIADAYIEVDAKAGVTGAFSFDLFQNDPLTFQAGPKAHVYVLPASGNELASLPGIGDGTLFSQNVRLSLGDTKINKGIRLTISDQKEHVNFSLYNNGITIICQHAEVRGEKLEMQITLL